MARPKIAMLLFLSSESVFFLVLILSYVYFHASQANVPGATPAASLDFARTGIFTACLLASSLTVWLAVRAIRRGSRGALRFWLAVTIVLGAVFLVGQGKEYLRLIDKQVTVSRDVFSGSFYTLTGFHGLHVFVGLMALLIALALAQAGEFTPGDRADAVDVLSWYWHFVDGVWVLIFSIVYLWTARS